MLDGFTISACTSIAIPSLLPISEDIVDENFPYSDNCRNILRFFTGVLSAEILNIHKLM
jgi:hypothetical protein